MERISSRVEMERRCVVNRIVVLFGEECDRILVFESGQNRSGREGAGGIE
jgi:hypothetical protein